VLTIASSLLRTAVAAVLVAGFSVGGLAAEGSGDHADPRSPPGIGWSPAVDAEASAWSHIDSARFAPGGSVEVGAVGERGRHEVNMAVEAERRPFEVRISQLAGDDERTRAVAREDTLALRASWDARWSERASAGTRAGASGRWSEVARDTRARASWGADVHLGAHGFDAGGFASADAHVARAWYPRYASGGRTLENTGAGGGVELGWSIGYAGELALRWAADATAYSDSRWDAVEGDGSIGPAARSRRYLANEAGVRVRARAGGRVRVDVEYALRRNDSTHYDLLVSGLLPDGRSEDRFVRDVWDWTRHTVEAGVVARPIERLRVELDASWSRRGFDTYQARSAQNVWLDETRVDHGITVDAEVELTFAERDGWTSGGSAAMHWVRLRSNMRRQVSLATNQDASVAALGLWLRR
jgi:hypothetical protein